MKQTLPALRVDSQTITNLKSALEKFNEKQIVELGLQDFRRMAYELISQMVLKGESLNIKLRKQ